jgi:acyl transferase domain-containing protein
MIANVSGAFAGAEVADPEYWTRHISSSVLFRDGIRALHDKGYRTFLECGPQTTLLSLAKRSVPAGGSHWLSSLHPSLSDWRSVLRSVAQLYVNGVPIKWEEVHRGSVGQRIALPTYPFDRQRYWLDLPAASSAPAKSLEQLLLETDATEVSKALDWIEELSGAEADAMLRGAV